jgi:hypothetical protein
MGFSFCSRQAIAHLCHGTQPFACCSRQILSSSNHIAAQSWLADPPPLQSKAGFWRDCGPIQCCYTASCLSLDPKKGFSLCFWQAIAQAVILTTLQPNTAPHKYRDRPRDSASLGGSPGYLRYQKISRMLRQVCESLFLSA